MASERLEFDDATMRYGFGDREQTAGGLDSNAAFDPANVVMGIARQLSRRQSLAQMEVVELPDMPEESVAAEPAGSLQNPHIVDQANIPLTAPRGPGVTSKGYFRYPKQHGGAAS